MDKTIVKALAILSIIVVVIVLFLSVTGFACYYVSKPFMANYYYDLGVTNKMKGWPIKSKEAFEKAIEVAPGSDFAKKSEAYMDTKLPKTKNLTQEAIDLNIKGYRAEKNGQYDKAKTYYYSAIDAVSDFEWPYSNLGNLYYSHYKDFDQAEENYKKAIDINPHYVNALVGYAYIMFAEARKELDKKNYDRALSLFNKSLDNCMLVKKLDPDFYKIDTRIEDLTKYINLTKENQQKS